MPRFGVEKEFFDYSQKGKFARRFEQKCWLVDIFNKLCEYYFRLLGCGYLDFINNKMVILLGYLAVVPRLD